jgi:dienelactone hydrolase
MMAPIAYQNSRFLFWLGACLLLFQIVDSFVVQPQQPSSFSFTKNVHSHQHQYKILLHRQPRIELSSSSGDLEEELSPDQVEALTVPQLKQQLRLRGLKVSGKKRELTDRLLNFSSEVETESLNSEEPQMMPPNPLEPDVLSESESNEAQPNQKKARELAEQRGKNFIDVDAFLDDDDKGKSVKSSLPVNGEAAPPPVVDNNPESSDPEVWGSDAKIVDDFEGKTPVVDAMSRTIVEFRGSNRTNVQAYVVASRDALRPFLAGGRNRTGDPEERLREIQMKREKAAKRPVRFEEDEGLDEGDETDLYSEILHRESSDWGKYTLTGAQLSAQEVQGVLLLSDVHGAFTDDTKTLAEKIAFECQPVVVMVPDLFRGKPWKEDPTTPGFNEEGQDFEEWRAMHSDLRVSIDIRAAAAVLKDQYGVSSTVVWGTCYGGGRALEIAAGYLPGGQIHDVDGAIGPVPVEPAVAVVWYPTRYNAAELFGADKKKANTVDGKERNMAVMGVFAGNDQLAGATPEDAAQLKSLLAEDGRVKDYMVKVFPNQDHGFAHSGLGQRVDESELDRFVDDEFGGAGRVSKDGGDAEVACLLSTAFMETYSRVFLPTAGPPISTDENGSEWSSELEMKDLRDTRDIRQEIEDSLDNFKEEPLGGKMMDPTDESQRDELAELLRTMEPKDVPPEYKIEEGDDLTMIYAKLKANDDSFQIF